MVFGVTAAGKIIGQDVSDTTRRNIAQLLKKFEPGILIDTEYISVPHSDKFAIVLHFEDSFMRKPFTFDGRAYMRLESTTQKYRLTLKGKQVLSRLKRMLHNDAYE